MYGENTKTIAIPIYRVLPYPVIEKDPEAKLLRPLNSSGGFVFPVAHACALTGNYGELRYSVHGPTHHYPTHGASAAEG